MINKHNIIRITAISLIISLCAGFISGCFNFNNRDNELKLEPGTGPESGQNNDGNNPVSSEFDLLLDELFADWVTNDALTMNFFLADPDKMGIERPESTFGEIETPEKIARDKRETLELAKRLDEFDYESLREDQKIVYDILKRSIELSEILDREEDYIYYTGYIRPLIGIQVQLPVLLAEFTFYTAEDIERYLDLIGDTHRYFSDIIEFERERSRRGFFMCEDNVDSVIEQIESYLKNREDNLLIAVFDYKIDNYPGLSSEQRELYKERNKELVLDNVLYAYETLLSAMQELRGVGARQGGLAELPGGSEYAHALLRLRVGTDRPAGELENMLKDMMDETLGTILELFHGEHQLFDGFLNGDLGQINDGTPKDYIFKLQKQMAADFPQLRDTQLVVLEVHESLQDHMSPAFYLMPAIDRFNDNIVYINPASLDDNLFFFTVLAHESYPGHMYQTVYFLQQSPHPIRISLSNTGYSEGWATYAEMRSYFFADISYEESVLMWSIRLYDMLLSSIIDLGVNIMGWSFEDTVDFLDDYGISDRTIARSIYNRVTGLPLNSLNYSLGYIEMVELYTKATEALGNNFDMLNFHRFILSFGPAPYPLIDKHLSTQLKSGASLRPAA